MAPKPAAKAVSGMRRAEQYEWRREELLRAALRIFAQRGVDGASMRDIANEADVVPGLLHHYFGKKEQLILEVIEHYGFLPGLDDILANTENKSAKQVLTKIATRYGDLLAGGTEGTDMMTLFFTGLANEQIRAGLNHHMATGQQHLAGFLAERVRTGELRRHDTTAAAAMLFAALSIGQLTGTTANPKTLVDLLLNGILNPAAQPAKPRPTVTKRARQQSR